MTTEGVPTGDSISDIDYVSKNPTLFSSAARSAFPMEMDEFTVEMQQNTIINMDPPQHQKVRRIVRNAFTPKRVDSYEPSFREHARRIVDAVATKGECEFVEDVAAELPLISILELLGVPLEDRKQFFTWTNTMIFADDPDMATSIDEAQVAAMEVIAYAMQLAEKHREQPMDNITSALLDAKLEGEPVSPDMFGWMFILILVGGNESTHGHDQAWSPYGASGSTAVPGGQPRQNIQRSRGNVALQHGFYFHAAHATEDVEVGGQLIKT
ncbi:MAG: hypothetical protein ACE37N_09220 [Pseudohongiellaceae bacterium]